MPIRSTTHSKKTLKQGAVAFVAAHQMTADGVFRCFAVAIQIKKTIRASGATSMMAIDVLEPYEGYDFHSVDSPTTGKRCIYPGDLGVRGYRYDDRAQQVFTTRRACERAIARWKGEAPNFIKEFVK